MKVRHRLPRPLLDRYEWQDEGLCRTLPVNTFFDLEDARGRLRKDREAAAKQVCRRCPVLGECLTHALACEDFGIWGGTTAQERQAMRALPDAS